MTGRHCEQGHKNKNFPIRSSYFRGAKFVQNQAAHVHNAPNLSAPANAPTSFDRSLVIATGSVDKVCASRLAAACC
jgi:hypothetical protein